MDNSQDGQKPGGGEPTPAVPTGQKPAEGVSDRTTEQFDKLTKSNSELKAEVDALKKAQTPSVLDSLKPTAPDPSPAVQPGNNPFIPKKEEGQEDDLVITDAAGNKFVDDKVLKKQLDEARKAADEAKKQAQYSYEQAIRYEESHQLKAAYEKHPQLDPKSDKFDEMFYKAVSDRMKGQAIEGKKDLVEAADNVATYYKTPEGSPAVQEKVEQKNQINAVPQRPAIRTPQASGADHEAIVIATRQGNKSALDARLKSWEASQSHGVIE